MTTESYHPFNMTPDERRARDRDHDEMIDRAELRAADPREDERQRRNLDRSRRQVRDKKQRGVREGGTSDEASGNGN